MATRTGLESPSPATGGEGQDEGGEKKDWEEGVGVGLGGTKEGQGEGGEKRTGKGELGWAWVATRGWKSPLP